MAQKEGKRTTKRESLVVAQQKMKRERESWAAQLLQHEQTVTMFEEGDHEIEGVEGVQDAR